MHKGQVPLSCPSVSECLRPCNKTPNRHRSMGALMRITRETLGDYSVSSPALDQSTSLLLSLLWLRRLLWQFSARRSEH